MGAEVVRKKKSGKKVDAIAEGLEKEMASRSKSS